MTSDTTQTQTQTQTQAQTQRQAQGRGQGQGQSAASRAEADPERVRDLIAGARVVLWGFDGPICRLFARQAAERVAAGLVGWLELRGLHGLPAESEREGPDPQTVLRAVDRRSPGSDLVAELEKRLTQEELRAAASAMPTAYADPLIRTWTAVGARLAVTTNRSPRAVRSYLAARGLLACFEPRVYGRTQDLALLKPDPHCVNRALDETGAAPSAALSIGGTPADFEAARAAGVPFLGYAPHERKATLLRRAGAPVVLGSLEPVLRLLREQPASYHRPGVR
ncbi:HAD hydrolase-like protein [Streptomyces sp. NPDC006134]|uniref:HAD family hydrolase n=1 Tax=Streptomyces sp. NPDC006134 TaxID=3154467 RepID=UPI0033E8145A